MSPLEALPEHGPAREAFILATLPAQPAPTWAPVTLGRVTLLVSRDYVCDRAPMTAATAQAVADHYGALLPTPEMVVAIEAAARACGGLVAFDAWPHYQDDSQLLTSTVLWREANIARRLGGRVPPIVAGHLKDVVLARFMPPGKVVIFGALDEHGKRVQPVYPIPGGKPGHGDYFGGGYAHGCRLVRADCLLDGAPARVADLLGRGMLGGPVAAVRYPTAAAAPTKPPATSSPPAPSTVLRRGDSGPRVSELQKLLTAAGWYVRADAQFGPLTESAVKAFQDAHGLAVDGLAGVNTLAALRAAAADAPPDTEPAPAIPFVQARNYHVGRARPIRCVVLHTMEAAEKPTTAENVAKWFASAAAPMASAHYCIDADSIVQGVREEDTAFAAPGLNADGIQLEHAGYAAQTAADWSDDYSRRMLARSAKLVAGICARHGIPIAFVDAAGLLRGERGITTHAEVTKAYRQSTHTDPGKAFPMTAYLAAVLAG